MKNQILSLLTCTVFFATTPAFCMQPEELNESNNLSKGTLATLPKELKVIIFDNIYEPRDVLSMRYVNKQFHKILKDKKDVTFRLMYNNKNSLVFDPSDHYNSINFSLYLGNNERKFCFGEFNLSIKEQVYHHDIPSLINHQDMQGLSEKEQACFLEVCQAQPTRITLALSVCDSINKTIFLPSYLETMRIWVKKKDEPDFKSEAFELHESIYPKDTIIKINSLCTQKDTQTIIPFNIFLSESNNFNYSLFSPEVIKKLPSTREQGLKKLQPKVRELYDAGTSVEDIAYKLRFPVETILETIEMNKEK